MIISQIQGVIQAQALEAFDKTIFLQYVLVPYKVFQLYLKPFSKSTKQDHSFNVFSQKFLQGFLLNTNLIKLCVSGHLLLLRFGKLILKVPHTFENLSELTQPEIARSLKFQIQIQRLYHIVNFSQLS